MRLATEYEMLCSATERAAMVWVMPRTEDGARRRLWGGLLAETRLRMVRIYQRRCAAVMSGGADYSFASYRRGEAAA